MEHLTKQQIVLLTLFVSFVTSIATGVVTVSLTDQSPVDVTGTIDHFIERTVTGDDSSSDVSDAPADSSNQASAITAASLLTSEQNQIPNAIASVQGSLVTIKQVNAVDQNGQTISKTTGVGTILTTDGVIVTDAGAIDPDVIATFGNYVAVLPNGSSFPVEIIRPQHVQTGDTGSLTFLSIDIPNAEKDDFKLKPAALTAELPKLGQNIVTLSMGDSAAVDSGIISRLVTVPANSTATSSASSTLAEIDTTVDTTNLLPGSVLFNTSGQILGIKTSAVTFYPISFVQAIISAQP